MSKTNNSERKQNLPITQYSKKKQTKVKNKKFQTKLRRVEANKSNSKHLQGALSSLRQLLAAEDPLKIMKNAFLFYLKSPFCSQDIYVFVLTFWSCKKTA